MINKDMAAKLVRESLHFKVLVEKIDALIESAAKNNEVAIFLENAPPSIIDHYISYSFGVGKLLDNKRIIYAICWLKNGKDSEGETIWVETQRDHIIDCKGLI